MGSEAAVTGLRVQAYTIPTDFPEADGTASWSSTTIIVVEAEAGGRHGFGYTYAHASIAPLIAQTLADAVRGTRRLDPSRGVASDAARGSQPGARGPRGHRESPRSTPRCGISRLSCSGNPWRRCSDAIVIPSRSTAAAASPTTTTIGSLGNSRRRSQPYPRLGACHRRAPIAASAVSAAPPTPSRASL